MELLVQSDVDNLMPHKKQQIETSPNNDSLGERLPKGIDALTLEKVLGVFSEKEKPLSAEEVGDILGASRTTARRYLEYLVSTEKLKAEVSYGSVGRPERKYF